jgi:sarcosine oxidase
MIYDTIVLGAGINGLSAAYHLLRRGAGKLALLERLTVGHTQGSSHGKSRITRSTYSTPKYVEMIQVAHAQEWPRMAGDAGRSFLHPAVGCFYGPGNGPYLDSVRAVPELRDAIEVLEVAQARRVFPQFRFPDSRLVIRDATCAVVSAEETVRWLGGWVASRADLVEHCPVSCVERAPQELRLHTPCGVYRCGRLVVTVGGWLGGLFPELAPKLQVAHQDVGYFEVEAGAEFPVWVYVPERGDSFYGLPEFARSGVKVARHRTGAEGDDPDRQVAAEMPATVRQELERFVAEQFASPARLVGYEACLYTNTVSEDFLLDHHPEDPRIVIGSACSGHGFKFGPLTGRLLSELLLDGRSSLDVFERHRDAFRLKSHADWSAAGTA